ncbi:gamma-glutamyl transferase [Cutibacterium acnes]
MSGVSHTTSAQAADISWLATVKVTGSLSWDGDGMRIRSRPSVVARPLVGVPGES